MCKFYSAQEMFEQWGLVNAMFPPYKLDYGVAQWIGRIVMNSQWDNSLTSLHYQTYELNDGKNAFLEQHAPKLRNHDYNTNDNRATVVQQSLLPIQLLNNTR
jgi:1,4-dihydroxy-2-naphthoyl-CoA synthase